MASLKQLFTITAILSCAAYSQGQYLKKGESGVGLSSTFQFDENAKGFELTPAYSFMGYVDIMGGYIKAFYEDEIPDGNWILREISADGYGAGISIHALKEDEKVPLTLSLKLLFMHTSLDSKAFDSFGMEVFGNTLGFALAASKRLVISSGMFLVPELAYTFGKTTAEIKFSDPLMGSDQKEKSNDWHMGLDLGFQKDLNTALSLILIGNLMFDDGGDNSQGIGLAFLIRI